MIEKEESLSEKREESNLLLPTYPPKKTYVYREEEIKEAVRKLKEIIVKREKEVMEEIIGEGLTSRQRDLLHADVKEKLSDVINKIFGKELTE